MSNIKDDEHDICEKNVRNIQNDKGDQLNKEEKSNSNDDGDYFVDEENYVADVEVDMDDFNLSQK